MGVVVPWGFRATFPVLIPCRSKVVVIKVTGARGSHIFWNMSLAGLLWKVVSSSMPSVSPERIESAFGIASCMKHR